MNIMILVCGGKRPPRRDEPLLSDEAWELIQQCWVMEPPNRPRMEDVAEQMMVIFKCVFPPTSARHDGILHVDAYTFSSTAGASGPVDFQVGRTCTSLYPFLFSVLCLTLPITEEARSCSDITARCSGVFCQLGITHDILSLIQTRI